MSVEKAAAPLKWPQRPATRVNYARGYGVGMWAWLLQRVTAVLLVVAVFSHFWVKVLFPTWGLAPTVIDMLLITLVSYHAFSGLRTILVDMGFGIRSQRVVFWATVLLALLTAAVALRTYQIRFLP